MNVWMVRAGAKSYLVDEFAKGFVAIGWNAMGDMTGIHTQDEMRRKYVEAYPKAKPGEVGNAVAMAFKFCRVIQKGDRVVTYDSANRQYLVGTVVGDYEYRPDTVKDMPNVRKVEWQGRVDRDALSVPARNSLGSVLTLFSVSEEVWDEFMAALGGEGLPGEVEEVTGTELFATTKEQSQEFIKDRITRLDPYDFQDLVAGVLRAMGYKTRVSSPGADRGVDILASPDGLGFEQPRIVVECKHRKGAIGAQEIRSFLGGRHKDDKGLYVSSGGFTKEARYEAPALRSQ